MPPSAFCAREAWLAAPAEWARRVRATCAGAGVPEARRGGARQQRARSPRAAGSSSSWARRSSRARRCPTGETGPRHLRGLGLRGRAPPLRATPAHAAAARARGSRRPSSAIDRAARLHRLLPAGRRHRRLRARARHPHGGPRLGRQLDRGLRARHHQRRPDPLRALLRALPPPRAARLPRPRHRPVLAAARRGDRARLRHLRRRPRGDDLDARHARRALGVPRDREGAGRAQRARQRAGAARPARARAPYLDRLLALAEARGVDWREPRAGPRAARWPSARRRAAAPLGPLRRGRDRRPAAHPLRAARARRQGDRRHAVRDARDRGDRAGQDGPARQPRADHDRRVRRAGRARTAASRCDVERAPRPRPRDRRAPRGRRHAQLLPARVAGDAPPAAHARRAHARRRRSPPSRWCGPGPAESRHEGGVLPPRAAASSRRRSCTRGSSRCCAATHGVHALRGGRDARRRRAHRAVARRGRRPAPRDRRARAPTRSSARSSAASSRRRRARRRSTTPRPRARCGAS